MSRAVTLPDPSTDARPASVELLEGRAVFHGHEEFTLTPAGLSVSPEDPHLGRKYELLEAFLAPQRLADQSVLGLGAGAAFLCYWALLRGAQEAIAVDTDERYLDMARSAARHLGFGRLRVVSVNVADWGQPADVVCALAPIQWAPPCAAVTGSSHDAIRHLSDLTRHVLLVEWVSPHDPAVECSDHLSRDCRSGGDPYAEEVFQSELGAFFANVELLGEITSTRRLYAASRRLRPGLNLRGPLPVLRPETTVVSDHLVASHEGVDYWSRVYDDPSDNVVVKQGTSYLASHEYQLLRQLDSVYFPRVYDVQVAEGFSALTMEKVDGLPLGQAIPAINSSPAQLCAFVGHCLNLLAQLRAKGIVHRDIQPANLLVRNLKPVLVDFGWAISRGLPHFSPPRLNAYYRPPDGQHCDVYSMGRVLRFVNRSCPPLAPIIELMAEPETSIRVTDLEMLKLLVAAVSQTQGRHDEREAHGAEQLESGTADAVPAIGRLLHEISTRDGKLELLHEELQVASEQLTQREQAIQALTVYVQGITGSTGWPMLQALWRIRLRLAPHGSTRERILRLSMRTGRVYRREGLRALVGKVRRRVRTRWERATESGRAEVDDAGPQEVDG